MNVQIKYVSKNVNHEIHFAGTLEEWRAIIQDVNVKIGHRE